MKRYVLLVFSLILFHSCSIENDNPPNFFLEVMSIESVTIPQQFYFGEVHEISMTYRIPNDCYEFNDFIYQVNGNERTVAVVNTVYTNAQCNTSEELVEVSFDFVVNDTGPYIFKFFQGQDSTTNLDQYYIVEVPVVN